MAGTTFEKMVEKAIGEAKNAMVSLQAGDSFGHAQLKGQIIGLTQSLQIARDVARQSGEELDV